MIGGTAASFAALASLFNWGVERGLDIRPDLLITVPGPCPVGYRSSQHIAPPECAAGGHAVGTHDDIAHQECHFSTLIVIWLIVCGDSGCGSMTGRNGLVRRLSAFGAGMLLAAGVLLLLISWLGLLPAFIDGNRSLFSLAAQHLGEGEVTLHTWALASTKDRLWLGILPVVLSLCCSVQWRRGLTHCLIALVVTVGAYVLLNPRSMPIASSFCFPSGSRRRLGLCGGASTGSGEKLKQCLAVSLVALGVITPFWFVGRHGQRAYQPASA